MSTTIALNIQALAQAADSVLGSIEAQSPAVFVQKELEAVKQRVLAIAEPRALVLAEALNHSLRRTGKLFRPVILLLMVKALNPNKAVDIAAIETAAVAEMIHTATLLHDDVLDDAELRRQNPTINATQGNKLAILAGDYLLAQASWKLSQLNNCRLVAIFAEVLTSLCDGELIQLTNQNNLELSWQDYELKTFCKTASLFQACAESAAIIAQSSAHEIESLKHYGKALGMAFQLQDDLLDFTATEEELGKPVLDDVKNGILTAPVLLALQDTTLKPQLEALISNVIETPSNENKQALLALLHDSNALQQTAQLVQEYTQQALNSISYLADSDYKTALMTLAQQSSCRKN